MGAEGLEPPSVSWRLQIYSLAQSPLCHTPESVCGRQRADGRTDMHALPTAYRILPTVHAPRTGVEPVPTPRQGAMRSVTPTRPTNQQGEQGNRTLATTFTVSRAATTPNSPSHLDRNVFPRSPACTCGAAPSGRGGTRTLTAPN